MTRVWPTLALVILVACSKPGVVVIGGGPAGLAAAIEAANAHHRTDVYEAREELGGSALYGDAVTAVPSAAALDRLDAASQPNAARTRFIQRLQPDVIDWLSAMGQVWRPLPNTAEPDVALLTPQGRGASIVVHLVDAAKAAGVTFHLGEKVTGLERADRAVTVKVGTRRVAAAAVIIATGGFAGNIERVRQRLDLADDIPLLRGATSFADGNGIDLALAVGATERLPSQVLLYAHGVPDPNHDGAAVMFMDGDRAWPIDREGAVFNEMKTPRGDSGLALLARPGSSAWVILDRQTIGDIQLWSVDARGFVKAHHVSQGVGTRGDNAEDLARKLRVAPEAVTAGLTVPPARPDSAHPLARGRLTALPLRLTTAKSLTGLQIDLDGRLLDASGTIIPHLYAAGEAAGFAHPWEAEHIDSTMVSGAILTGRVAGQTAAADLDD